MKMKKSNKMPEKYLKPKASTPKKKPVFKKSKKSIRDMRPKGSAPPKRRRAPSY